ncbi:MAG: DUF4124 domain-containing protein [Thermodesulfobacteriota bacterium]
MKKILFLLAIVLVAAPAMAKIFKWTDDKGKVHVTDNYHSVPEKYREQFAEEMKKEQSSPGSSYQGTTSTTRVKNKLDSFCDEARDARNLPLRRIQQLLEDAAMLEPDLRDLEVGGRDYSNTPVAARPPSGPRGPGGSGGSGPIGYKDMALKRFSTCKMALVSALQNRQNQQKERIRKMEEFKEGSKRSR